MGNEKMKRVVLDLPSNKVDKLDELKKKIGVKTRAAVIRNALALLKTVSEKKKECYVVQFKKGEEVIEVVMPFC